MNALVELLAAAVVALAAAAFSHLGVAIEQPQTSQAEESRAVRRSPAAEVRSSNDVDCPEAAKLHV